LRGAALPRRHRDPFDRLLVAQAQMEELSVVTADRAFGLYDVDVIAAWTAGGSHAALGRDVRPGQLR
jgi:hypothetical protein